MLGHLIIPAGVEHVEVARRARCVLCFIWLEYDSTALVEVQPTPRVPRPWAGSLCHESQLAVV